jgi:hypothetical protein
LRQDYQILTENIVTHNEVNSKTECPGENFLMDAFLNQIE